MVSASLEQQVEGISLKFFQPNLPLKGEIFAVLSGLTWKPPRVKIAHLSGSPAALPSWEKVFLMCNLKLTNILI